MISTAGITVRTWDNSAQFGDAASEVVVTDGVSPVIFTAPSAVDGTPFSAEALGYEPNATLSC